MPALKNIRLEKFCQGIVSGLSQTKAYTGAGYSELGAKQSAARLMANADVRARIAELRHEVESRCVRLQITERNQRLQALQDRWDALRQAKAALAHEDYAAAIKTGVVLRKKRWIGGKDGYEVEDYKINTALIEGLNSVERRAAIETGQEVDRQDINLREKVNDEAEVLKKAFTFEELSAMDRRMKAARNGKVIEAPAVNGKENTSGEVEGGVTPSQAPSWRD